MALTDFTNGHTRIDTRPATPRFSLMTMLSVWRSRRALAQLDAHALEDIGISAKRAQAEASKPIWDVPATWRK
ncbi:DUF1127 domain-containing protein [Tateyamaria armeniaca]|uniref:DUF1127 domain-containing protein n=1 Tax=Tateyamaria armeniaca TaxID=2518930 RepID=A0ABW8V1C5_9RHOB